MDCDIMPKQSALLLFTHVSLKHKLQSNLYSKDYYLLFMDHYMVFLTSPSKNYNVSKTCVHA